MTTMCTTLWPDIGNFTAWELISLDKLGCFPHITWICGSLGINMYMYVNYTQYLLGISLRWHLDLSLCHLHVFDPIQSYPLMCIYIYLYIRIVCWCLVKGDRPYRNQTPLHPGWSPLFRLMFAVRICSTGWSTRIATCLDCATYWYRVFGVVL